MSQNIIFDELIKNSYGGKNWLIIHGDCLSVIDDLPHSFADAVITSPPFNLGISSGGGFPKKKKGKWSGGSLAKGYGSYNDAMPFDDYKRWQSDFLKKAWLLLNDKGAIFYNHKPRIQNGIVSLPTEWNPNLPLRQIVIWSRKGGINFSPSFYLPTHEYILIYAKPDFHLKSKAASGVGDVWTITQEKNNFHPSAFPVELPLKILHSISKRSGIVIDPFSGSSTTGVAALMCGFRYIGIETEKEYVDSSIERLRQTEKNINNDLFKENHDDER